MRRGIDPLTRDYQMKGDTREELGHQPRQCPNKMNLRGHVSKAISFGSNLERGFHPLPPDNNLPPCI